MTHSPKFLRSALLKSLALAAGFAAALSAPAQTTAAFPGLTAVSKSSAALSVTVPVTTGGTVASVTAYSQGATAQDFKIAAGGSCDAAAVLAGGSCTAQVVFTPQFPGQRLGAVRLLSSGGTVLGQALLSGMGQGSLAVLKPGLIDTVAGSGDWIYRGDGDLATHSPIFLPMGIVTDAVGNLFLSDSNNNRVRRIDAKTGIISTVAGSGTPGLSGDGNAATQANITSPAGLVLDGAGNLYFVDSGNMCVRRVDALTTRISTVAGVCGVQGYDGDKGAATAAKLSLPEGLALGTDGSLYIGDTGNNVVRKVDPNGIITTVAGNGNWGYLGDGGQATAARLQSPWGVAIGPDGSLYIADLGNNVVRRVSTAGIITTVAGTGVRGFTSDKVSALQSELAAPAAVALDPAGNLFIGDSGNNRVREVAASTGLITTVAGNSNTSVSGDGGPADQASLYGPYALWVDQIGQLFIADMFHNRVRRVTANTLPLQYSTIRVSKTSSPQAVGLENDGNSALNVTDFTLDQSALDAATTTCSKGSLASGAACTLGVEFAPTVVGDLITGHLTVVSDAGNSPDVVTLTGQVLTVNPSSATLVSSLNPSLSGGAVTFTATVSSSATGLTGTVDFLDGTTVLCKGVTLAASAASCTTAQLAVGQHSITAVYSGDSENAAATSPSLTQVVKQPATVALTAGPNPATVTQTVTLSAAVAVATGTASGTLTFYADGAVLGSTTLSATGTGSVTTDKLSAGTHALTANYSGDSNNAAAISDPVSEVVNLASTVTTASVDKSDITVGNTITLSATVTSSGGPEPTGSVQFLDGAVSLGTATLASATTTFSVSTLTPGTHHITARFLGDSSNDVSSSVSLTVLVEQVATVSLLSSDSNPANAGGVITLSATVSAPGASTNTTSSSNPAGTLSGNVSFLDGATTLGTTVLDANGHATLQTATLTVGTHNITASFAGNTNYATSTSTSLVQVVNKTASATQMSISSTGLAGKTMSMTARVSSATGTPTGQVNFLDGATVLGTTALSSKGIATFSSTTLSVGDHQLSASYAGDSNYVSSASSPAPETIALATSTLTLAGPTSAVNAGTAVAFTAALASNGVTPTGTVNLMEGSTVVATQAAGSAISFSISTLSLGQHTLTVKYAGDADNAASLSNAVLVTVQQGDTVTSLASSKSPQTLNAAVTFTATVTSPSPSLTGTVSFFDGSTLLGSTAINTNGTATLSTSTLTFGVHSITAVYSGDTNHAASTSPAIEQRIVQAATLAVTSSANPAVTGATVTLTARLSGSASLTPSGTVLFLDGASTLGTATIDASGTATFASSTLAVGVHNITVTYAGDTNYAAATSAMLTETIVNADTQVALSSSANPATYATALTLTARVTSNGGIPTGKLNFVEGATVLGSAVLDSNGVATVTLSTLAPGTHTISASYAGDGKASASVSAPLTQAVRQTTTVALASSANPAATLSSITFTATVTNAGQDIAAGLVTFTDGSTTLGTAALDASGNAAFTMPLLAAGAHAVVATYAGNNTNFGATSPALAQTVDLRPTTTTLTATTDPTNNQQVTLIGVVRYTGPSVPTGAITFSSASGTIGTVAVDSTGVATLVITIGQSSQTVTATYAGDASYKGSSSPATTIKAEDSPQFKIAMNPSSFTFTSGQHGTGTLTLTSVSTFADTMQFGCLGLPTAATCTFSATSQALKAGGTLSVQVTVDTGNPLGSGSSTTNAAKSQLTFALLPSAALAGLAIFGLRRRKKLASLLALLVAIVALGSTTGCAGLKVNSTPAGKYTFQVVARGQNTGVAESQTVTLNVQ